AVAELRYSIPEEMKEGTIVGNVAKDLGLDKTALLDRRFRVVSGSKDAFFESIHLRERDSNYMRPVIPMLE
ncbi:protocadherin alpha-8-like protein, partial [Lates japonicus]